MQKIFSLLMTAAVALLAVSPIQAETGKHQRRHPLSRDEAAKVAQERFHGRLLDIRRQERDEDGFRYRVKMLEKGRVLIFNINGMTGEIED